MPCRVDTWHNENPPGRVATGVGESCSTRTVRKCMHMRCDMIWPDQTPGPALLGQHLQHRNKFSLLQRRQYWDIRLDQRTVGTRSSTNSTAVTVSPTTTCNIQTKSPKFFFPTLHRDEDDFFFQIVWWSDVAWLFFQVLSLRGISLSSLSSNNVGGWN